jgi:adenylate cyclase
MPIDEILATLTRHLNASGLGIGRAYLGIRLLNPLVNARGYIYRRDEDSVRGEDYEHTQMPSDYRASPIRYMVMQGIHHLYRPLVGPTAQLDFPVLQDFAASGFTAWMAHFIPFTLNLAAAPDTDAEPIGIIFTLCCDRPGGWTASDQAVIQQLLPHLGAAIQGLIFATFAQDLLTTYLGGDAARQVLQGTTTRGNVRRLRAAILYADLRGFTERAETADPSGLVTSLDHHFDQLVSPIMAHKGEVLKFMGDGLLAVFPTAPGSDAAACAAALDAAHDALAGIAGLSASDPHAMAVDIALHLGDVLYGNVGGKARLDFTVIGPAVNAASRMEGKCKELGVPLILSGDVAGCLPLAASSLRSLGRHPLRGIAGDHELFTLI